MSNKLNVKIGIKQFIKEKCGEFKRGGSVVPKYIKISLRLE